MNERVQVSRSVSRCPYCHDDLKVERDIVACAPCGARHHRGCHAEHGRCASCGAEEALYPRSGEERRVDPPRGSKVSVVQTEQGVEYSWPVETSAWQWVVTIILCCLLPPLVYFLLRDLPKRPKELVVALNARNLRLPAVKAGQHRLIEVVMARENLDHLSLVEADNGQASLFIDEGVQRYMLAAAPYLAALSAPELRWLKERIEAWKREA